MNNCLNEIYNAHPKNLDFASQCFYVKLKNNLKREFAFKM